MTRSREPGLPSRGQPAPAQDTPPDSESTPAFTIRRANYEAAASIFNRPLVPEPFDPGPPTQDVTEDPGGRHIALQVIRAMVEILDGRRSTDHLEHLATLSVVRNVKATRDYVHSASAPLRRGPVHLTQPQDGTIEAVAVCRWGQQVVAIAARFDEVKRHDWRCTEFRLIRPARTPGPNASGRSHTRDRRPDLAHDRHQRGSIDAAAAARLRSPAGTTPTRAGPGARGR